MNVTSTVVGYPYIGEARQWKRTLEAFWKQQVTEEQLEAELKEQRIARLKHLQHLGLQYIPVGDFTKYDRMLDISFMFGLVPARYDELIGTENELYYAMARGAKSVVACEMTKWFNTNYHYIVPEYTGKPLSLQHNYLLQQFIEAKEEVGILAKPTLIGPYTFLDLAKGYNDKERALFLLQLLPLYVQVINELAEAGAQWVQLEEPSLTKELADDEMKLIEELYKQISEQTNCNIMLQTYFEAVPAYERIVHLPVAGIGLDFVQGGSENVKALRQFGFPKGKTLSIGAINGRDIWSANLAEVASIVSTAKQLSGADDIWISSSCSLQHVPVTKVGEEALPEILYNHLAFADEKVREIAHATYFATHGQWLQDGIVAKSMQAIEALETDASRQNKDVHAALQALTDADFHRAVPYSERLKLQQEALQLPNYPTTTIGSFPQSATVKRTRSAWRKKDMTDAEYAQFVADETARWIAIQEDIGLDVLVHGEFERTDMVEYFGEHLSGFAFTKNAWVVSYGSRCVKPPIIYGDVQWTHPMTVKEVADAQKLTTKYVKGMLTGPVTILNWSFVRNDISRKDVAYQIGLAIRQEVAALEKAGIRIIQVDEPALREGLPLRKDEADEYIAWGVEAFKLATSSVEATTQIHTHMCYCEFNDFIEPIRALDADVISLETSRSHGELIDALQQKPYELGIGLGVYDIHSPRVPSIDEMGAILRASTDVIGREQFWVNPDCGLKTRGEEETIAALKNMVAAAKQLRAAGAI